MQAQLRAVLRPFIFRVHPDLFGDYPQQKIVNETSLKLLNEYIQRGSGSWDDKLRVPEQKLNFFQRINHPYGFKQKADIKPVQVKLDGDVLRSIRELLQKCSLPLHVIDDLIESRKYIQENPSQENTASSRITWIQKHYFAATGKEYPFGDVWDEVNILRPAVTLHHWITSNIARARQLELDSFPVRTSYLNESRDVKVRFELANLDWACGWRGTHQLASLRKLEHLLLTNHELAGILKDRTVIFGNASGVSCNGDVILSSDEVPEQWSHVIRHSPSCDAVLTLIHPAEQQLSQLLGGIRIVRRSQPQQPSVVLYYRALSRLISRLGMAHQLTRSDSDHGLKCVIGCSSGEEMTVTDEGHIVIPSDTPVWALRNFVRDVRETAHIKSLQHERNRTKAEELIQQVKQEYELHSLSIASSVSFDKTVACCDNLLTNSDSVRFALKGMRLCIAPYFAVMNDGELYIQWDWGKATRV